MLKLRSYPLYLQAFIFLTLDTFVNRNLQSLSAGHFDILSRNRSCLFACQEPNGFGNIYTRHFYLPCSCQRIRTISCILKLPLRPRGQKQVRLIYSCKKSDMFIAHIQYTNLSLKIRFFIVFCVPIFELTAKKKCNNAGCTLCNVASIIHIKFSVLQIGICQIHFAFLYEIKI